MRARRQSCCAGATSIFGKGAAVVLAGKKILANTRLRELFAAMSRRGARPRRGQLLRRIAAGRSDCILAQHERIKMPIGIERRK